MLEERIQIAEFELSIDGAGNATWDFDFTVIDVDLQFGFPINEVFRFFGTQRGTLDGETIVWDSVEGTSIYCIECDGFDDQVRPLTDATVGWMLGSWTVAD